MSVANLNVTGRASVASEHSRQKCYVRFVNKTKRVVDVIWIDFSGKYVKYSLLNNGEFIDVNTYKRHCWIAVDTVTKDAMLLNGVYRYEPEIPDNVRAGLLRYNRDPLPVKVRIVVYITLPVYSLYFRCLIAVRDTLESEEDVDGLELTWCVKEHLKMALKQKMERRVSLPLGEGEI